MNDNETMDPFAERLAKQAEQAKSAESNHKPALIDIAIGPDGLQLNSYEQVVRIAKLIHLSGLAPSGFRRPEQIMVALLRALELKLPPFQALESMSVINNRVGLMTNLMLSMVESSGLLENKKVRHEGAGDELTCIVSLKRRGRERNKQPHSYSVRQAKTAGIYERSSAWRGYPERMTYARAMGFALQDEFADVLRGIKGIEELQDFPDAQVTGPVIPEMPNYRSGRTEHQKAERPSNSVEPISEEL